MTVMITQNYNGPVPERASQRNALMSCYQRPLRNQQPPPYLGLGNVDYAFRPNRYQAYPAGFSIAGRFYGVPGVSPTMVRRIQRQSAQHFFPAAIQDSQATLRAKITALRIRAIVASAQLNRPYVAPLHLVAVPLPGASDLSRAYMSQNY